jgi:glutathione peroxidase
MIQFLIILLMSAYSSPSETVNVHQFSLKTINGDEINLSEFSGNVLLIVNTASQCGFTSQYEGLQELYNTYNKKGLKILGFPANNFGNQEPGTNEEIAQFCERNFGVTFPMFSKIDVKGENQHPLFRFLTAAENPDFEGDINWNFEKFLVDQDGNLIRRFRSQIKPMSIEIKTSIEALLD